jgi:hypothetical protein
MCCVVLLCDVLTRKTLCMCCVLSMACADNVFQEHQGPCYLRISVICGSITVRSAGKRGLPKNGYISHLQPMWRKPVLWPQGVQRAAVC